MSKTNEEILELWADQEKCPDFKPILEEILKDRDDLEKELSDIKKGIALKNAALMG